jgi:hypothetical protein
VFGVIQYAVAIGFFLVCATSAKEADLISTSGIQFHLDTASGAKPMEHLIFKLDIRLLGMQIRKVARRLQR